MSVFDRMAWCYDWFPVPTHVRALRRVLAGRGGVVVDVGGGTGKFTARIFGRTDRVLVVDMSRPMLRRARRRRLGAVQGSAAKIPLPDSSADVVLCTEAFHHFGADQDQALAEAARVLRPDGVFVMEEPDPSRRPGRWMAHGEHAAHMGSRFHSPPELAAMVARRFEVVRQEKGSRSTVIMVAERPRPGTPHPTL